MSIVEQITELPIYTSLELARELRQAEILSDIKQHVVTLGDDGLGIDETLIPFAVIVTQDCDLVQEFDRRQQGQPSDLNSIMLFQAFEAEGFRAQIKGADIWKRIRQNKDERYQALEKVEPDADLRRSGLPALIIDFKRSFSMTPVALYEQISSMSVRRRTRLEMPYREHLQARAAFFMQRVMLPRQHVLS